MQLRYVPTLPLLLGDLLRLDVALVLEFLALLHDLQELSVEGDDPVQVEVDTLRFDSPDDPLRVVTNQTSVQHGGSRK